MHSPEPWSVISRGPANMNGYALVDANRKVIPDKWKYHDFARIVLCVNAMAGIRNPQAWSRAAVKAIDLEKFKEAYEFELRALGLPDQRWEADECAKRS